MSDVTLTETDMVALDELMPKFSEARSLHDWDGAQSHLYATVKAIVAARVGQAGAKALEDAAVVSREYLTTPNVSIADWLRDRAVALRAEGSGDRD